MRVFSQINNCQQKQKQKTDKTKRGAPLLGLAKSIYYRLTTHPQNLCWHNLIKACLAFVCFES